LMLCGALAVTSMPTSSPDGPVSTRSGLETLVFPSRSRRPPPAKRPRRRAPSGCPATRPCPPAGRSPCASCSVRPGPPRRRSRRRPAAPQACPAP
jgi:hypothetical protein